MSGGLLGDDVYLHPCPPNQEVMASEFDDGSGRRLRESSAPNPLQTAQLFQVT